ncbi:uncharacterized protein LOC143341132 [Colletes latitarsis]|uniref:uncharacterized protein LOC143341132 n=1 Tax=Colletes latitarsis TaxID=2605962 RepID=UPI004035C1F6
MANAPLAGKKASTKLENTPVHYTKDESYSTFHMFRRRSENEKTPSKEDVRQDASEPEDEIEVTVTPRISEYRSTLIKNGEDIWVDRPNDRKMISIKELKDTLKPIMKSRDDIEDVWADRPNDREIISIKELKDMLKPIMKPRVDKPRDEIEDIWADWPRNRKVNSIRNTEDELKETPKPYIEESSDEIEDIWADRPQDCEIKPIWKEDAWKPKSNDTNDRTDSSKSKSEPLLVKSTDKPEEEIKPKLKTTRKRTEKDKKEVAKPKVTSRKIDDVGKKKEPTTRRRSSTKSTDVSKDHEPMLDTKQIDTVPGETKVHNTPCTTNTHDSLKRYVIIDILVLIF